MRAGCFASGYREGLRSPKLEFLVVDIAKNGFRGEVDWLDILVHFHSNIFGFNQWYSSGFLQQFKGFALGGSTFSLSFCDWDGGL